MNITTFLVALVVNVVLSCIIGYFSFPEPGLPYDGFFYGAIVGSIHGGCFIGNWILGTFVYDPATHLMYSAESGLGYKIFFWMAAIGTVLQIFGALFKKSILED